jgi:hypothetical protein
MKYGLIKSKVDDNVYLMKVRNGNGEYDEAEVDLE